MTDLIIGLACAAAIYFAVHWLDAWLTQRVHDDLDRAVARAERGRGE